MMMKLVVMFHELGHVNDFERLFSRPGAALDVIQTELYAHHYTCRQLIQGRYRIALGWYLLQLEELAQTDDTQQGDAARRLVRSRKYRRYWAEVSPFFPRNGLA